ncbi:general secretion pathway protein E [Shewanella sediminis HAW-EB3]|uniref:General secretion pathway protein E n=1 Tax=Shewanella sediminis (strain HAW-EB3) TaxID=425104 RepID=A8FXR0_SHESH|nr:GspE/PulE family protein [Shewanella sediminis]ABV37633.1 general secretion pathway protein E [Shewanella sediminis HAW-EB3]
MNIETLLTQDFAVSTVDIEKAIAYQKRANGRLEKILVNMGALSEEVLPRLYSKLLQLPLVDINALQDWQAPVWEEKVDLSKLVEHGWYPLQQTKGVWTIAVQDPLNFDIMQLLEFYQIQFELQVLDDETTTVLVGHYQDAELQTADNELSTDEEERLKELATEAPTVNLLNSLIGRALKAGASDMHLEPYQEKYRIRFRIDGVLQDIEMLPAKMRLPIASRLKILSGMDIAEKRKPQDGKIEMKIASEEFDIRVSALPLNDGESIVMRFLRKEAIKYDMDVLGLSGDIRELIEEDLKTTAGVILLTGPTGSGKTTSLYTFLNSINNSDVKIITLEDPVEYQLEGVNQVQVQSEIGFDFSAGLRSIVRQDPDVIMLGEIRDSETAQIAMQSALTGHLVFSTVHTNDAASAYTRLIDLGAEEFLLNAAITSVIAQRLARKLCKHCSLPHPDADKIIEKYQLRPLADQCGVEINLHIPNGCEHCNESGYSGRIAIVEYLRCDDEIKMLPKDKHFPIVARETAKKRGYRNLLEDGLYKAMIGITSVDEVLRVAG